MTSGEDLFVNWADVPSVVLLDDGTLAAHWLQCSGLPMYAYDVRLSWSRDAGKTWDAVDHSAPRWHRHRARVRVAVPGAWRWFGARMARWPRNRYAGRGRRVWRDDPSRRRLRSKRAAEGRSAHRRSCVRLLSDDGGSDGRRASSWRFGIARSMKSATSTSPDSPEASGLYQHPSTMTAGRSTRVR